MDWSFISLGKTQTELDLEQTRVTHREDTFLSSSEMESLQISGRWMTEHERTETDFWNRQSFLLETYRAGQHGRDSYSSCCQEAKECLEAETREMF